MKQTKSALVLVSVLIMSCIWGFIIAYKSGYIPTGLHVLILALIMIAGIYAFVTHLKQHKDVQSGFPAEDEMSTRIKYKAGYYAFLASLYMWLFVFMFKGVFDVSGIRESGIDAILGGGIMTMAVISIVIKIYLTRHYHENQD
jgi:nicotinamide riboside transporter PnuC